MEKIKIQNVKNGVVKEVNKSLAGDYIGTGDFKLYEEKKFKVEPEKSVFSKIKNKED